MEFETLGLKGTTVVAFYFTDKEKMVPGIMLGVDSRVSSRFHITDVGKKAIKINDNMAIIMSGSGIECDRMCKEVMDQYHNKEHLVVEDILNKVVDHLNAHLDEIFEKGLEDAVVGTIVAGWDEKQNLQLYRTRLHNRQFSWQDVRHEPLGCVASGSGRTHALETLESRKNVGYTMSVDDAAELALRALFRATYLDKYTGGTLHVYHVDKNADKGKIVKKHEVGAMDAYSRYYNHKDFSALRQKTMFLLCLQHIYADDLKGHFGSKQIEAAGSVAKIGDFYFHRLLCTSPDVASTLYGSIKSSQNSPPPCLEKFPYGSYLESGVPYYVEKSSEDLLNHLGVLEKKLDSKCIDLLQVYLEYYHVYYGMYNYERRTLFMASSVKLGSGGVTSIKNQFRPLGELPQTRWVAKRGNFYFYRFFFRSENEASSAYGYIKGLGKTPPLRNDLPCFRVGMYSTPGVAVYAEKCSIELLKEICKLAPEVKPKHFSYILNDDY